MIDWLRHIGDLLGSFFDSISGVVSLFVDSIKQFFEFIMQAIDFISTALRLVPSVYYAFGFITIAILIALAVAGRNAGGD